MKDAVVSAVPDTITVNGVLYTKGEFAPRPTGKRAVVVVDRGWIFAGDVTETDGRIKLTRAVWVFSWQTCGFSGVVESPKRAGVDIRKMPTDVDIPADAEVFRVPVADDWGL